MTDIVLTPVTTGYNISSINTNFAKVQDKINSDILQVRTGDNVMYQDLDLNSNRLLNAKLVLAAPTAPTDGVRLVELNQEAATRASSDAALQAQISNIVVSANSGTIGYLTLAAMNADLNKPAGTVGLVTNDPTPSNNQTYVKIGAVGSGSWQATYDRVTLGDQTIVNNLSASSGAGLVGYMQAGVGATARTVLDKLRERFSVKDFGAIGDGVTNDAPAIQRAFDQAALVGACVYFPKGRYLINATVSLNLTGHTNENAGNAAIIEGAGSNNTVIINNTNNVGVDILGNMDNNSVYSYFKMDGVTITKGPSATAGTDTGLRVRQSYCTYFNDILFLSNGTGFQFSDCVLMTQVSCYYRFNKQGLLGSGQVATAGSTPNAITLIGCCFILNSEYGQWFEGGCTVVMVGGSVESTTGGVNAQRFGVRLNNMGSYGRAACAYYGVYFERNGNIADVFINNLDSSNTYLFSGCVFNRLLSNEFNTNNILLATNGNLAARITLVTEACAFSRFGTYVPSASRPYVNITGATPVEFRAIGNLYSDNIERPNKETLDCFARAKFIGSSGALIRSANVNSISRTGTGKYRVNYQDSNTNINSGRTISVMTDISGYNYVTSESNAGIEFQCTNTAGTPTDPGSVSVVIYE